RSVLRLPLGGAVALAGARGAGALVGVSGAVAVVVEAVGGVGVVVGVVVVVEVSAAAVEAVAAVAAAGVAEAVEVAEAAEAVVELVAEVHRGVVPVVVSARSSSAVLRPPPLSSFVSGTLGVSAVEVLAPAPTFSVPETVLRRLPSPRVLTRRRRPRLVLALVRRHVEALVEVVTETAEAVEVAEAVGAAAVAAVAEVTTTAVEPGGAEPGGAATGGTEPGGAELGVTEPGGAEPRVTEPGGAEPGGAGSARVASGGASSRREVLSPRELREWFARRWSRAAGAGGTPATTGSGGTGPGGAGAAGPGGTAEAAGVSPTGGSAGVSGGTGAAGSAGPAAAGATGVGAAGGVGTGGSADTGPSEGAGAGAAGAGGATGAGAPAGSPGAVPAGSGGASRPRLYFVPLLEQVLGLPPSPSPAPPLECPQPVQSQSLLQPVSPLPAPSPYTGPTGGLAERTHQMALRPSTAPLRVPLPSPPATSLPAFPDPESASLRAASPTVARFLATVVTDPSLASTTASALVAELVDFAASCRLNYAAGLVAESASVCPPSVGGECALSTDILEDRQEEFQCFAAALPHLVFVVLVVASTLLSIVVSAVRVVDPVCVITCVLFPVTVVIDPSRAVILTVVLPSV
ncbi:unnamed protein product, partial [Closterium sp. NIES-54]